MKTAEEWADKINKEVLPVLTTPIPVSSVVNMVKQIQLNAWKQGMSDAANIAMRYQRSETIVAQDIQCARDSKTIL